MLMETFEVRMFAHLRDRHGERVTVDAEPSVGGVLAALQGVGVQTSRCRLSVNLEFAAVDAPIRPKDELALIPPVSGG